MRREAFWASEFAAFQRSLGVVVVAGPRIKDLESRLDGMRKTLLETSYAAEVADACTDLIKECATFMDSYGSDLNERANATDHFEKLTFKICELGFEHAKRNPIFSSGDVQSLQLCLPKLKSCESTTLQQEIADEVNRVVASDLSAKVTKLASKMQASREGCVFSFPRPKGGGQPRDPPTNSTNQI